MELLVSMPHMEHWVSRREVTSNNVTTCNPQQDRSWQHPILYIPRGVGMGNTRQGFHGFSWFWMVLGGWGGSSSQNDGHMAQCGRGHARMADELA